MLQEGIGSKRAGRTSMGLSSLFSLAHNKRSFALPVKLRHKTFPALQSLPKNTVQLAKSNKGTDPLRKE